MEYGSTQTEHYTKESSRMILNLGEANKDIRQVRDFKASSNKVRNIKALYMTLAI